MANERALISQQKINGNRLYTQAKAQSEPFDLSPAIQGIRSAASEYPMAFASRLQRAAGLFERGPNRQLVDNVSHFDNSKKALDDMIERAQRTGDGNLGRELTIFKKDLLDAVHAPDGTGAPTRNAVYKEARDTWGTAAEQREAIDMGRNALKQDSELTAEHYRSLSKFEQMLFRIGMKQGVPTALATKRPGNDVTQLFQQRRVQELLSEVIPRTPGKNSVFSDRPQRFGEYMRRQGRMVETNRKALGGSETAERLGDDAQNAADAVGRTTNALRGGTNAILEFVAAGASKVFGMRADVAAQLARSLTETDPAVRSQILNRIRQSYGPDAYEQFMRNVYARAQRGSAVAGATASQNQQQGY